MVFLPFETNMRIHAQPRPAEFRENLDRSLSRFFTHGDAPIQIRSVWITRLLYPINIHRRNWIANGNFGIGELITGNEEQTELSLAVLRRLIVFGPLKGNGAGSFAWPPRDQQLYLPEWRWKLGRPTINRCLILFSRCWRKVEDRVEKPNYSKLQSFENGIFHERLNSSRSVSETKIYLERRGSRPIINDKLPIPFYYRETNTVPST